MIKRLWLLACVVWSGLLAALACLEWWSGTATSNTVIPLCLVPVPWVLGYLLPFLFRYIVWGSPRRPPVRYYR